MKQKGKRQISNEELNRASLEIRPFIEKVISSLGFNLFEISFVREYQENYLRLTIFHQDRKVSLDDCELISKNIEKELDEKDVVKFSYILEVQSPGIDGVDPEREYSFYLKDLGLVVSS